jgi:ribosomal protein S6--L-glutamate ligase
LVEGVPRGAYPLILKPAFGDNARGLRVVDSPEQLRTLAWPEEPALAQAYLPGDGMDLKLYVIGAHLTAVHKPSPFTACTSASSGPVPMDGRLNQLARLCGQLFGLTVYGVDCLETDAGPVVVEVNDFPNFTTVPDADQLLARHVVSRAGGVA